MTDIWGPNLMKYARGVDVYVQCMLKLSNTILFLMTIYNFLSIHT